MPVYWPGGARRRGGVILVCGSCTEREKASVDTVVRGRRLQGRERERAEAETEGTEYQSRRSLADRPVVAVKRLLAGVGVERRGRLTRNVGSFNRGREVLGGSEDEHAKAQGQAVCDSQVDGVGGVSAGCGQQGCPGSGRAGAGRVRGRSEGQPLQDLESDELGVLLSASGQGGGDPQAARRRGPSARRAHDLRQDRSDGRGHVSGAAGGAEVPPGLLWLPAEQVGPGGGRDVSATVLGVRLDDRSWMSRSSSTPFLGTSWSGRSRRSPTAAGCCCM